jgi:hypothetical protein
VTTLILGIAAVTILATYLVRRRGVAPPPAEPVRIPLAHRWSGLDYHLYRRAYEQYQRDKEGQ